jgi:hypothetical protein
MRVWKKLLGLAALIGCLSCPSRAITPQVTITATSATLLGTTQIISLDCRLVDPNGTGILRVGTSVLTNLDTATVTPGTTATCGPLWGADVVTDGFGNINTTYYLVSVFVVTNGILASTPALSQAYQLDGSATYDLSTALPYSLGAVSPAGSVLGQNLTFTGTNNATGPWTFSNIITNVSNGTFTETTPTAGKYFRDNGTSFVPSTLLAADIPASTSQCTGVQFAIGINSGDVTNCATPPTFVASGASHAVGYVPDPGSSAGTTRFLREDATWVAVSGGSTVLNAQGDAGAITGTGSVATVYTYTLPGGTVANLKALRVTVGWSHSTGSASVSYNVTLNGVTSGCNASASTAGGINCTVTFLNTGSTTGDATSTSTVAGAAPAAALTGLAWSSNQVLKFTFNVANTDAVTPIEWLVEIVQ